MRATSDTLRARLVLGYLALVAAWTLWAGWFVVVDHGWGAVSVAGVGSLLVNSGLAIVASVAAVVGGLFEQRIWWRELAVALGAPAAAALIIWCLFAWANLA